MDQELQDEYHDVPLFFICPISLQLMKDPVIISTGITYDRESINKWFFTYKHTTCPVTKQILADSTLTPNSTLHSLIKSWLINNKQSELVSKKIDQISDPDRDYLMALVEELMEPKSQIKALRKMKSLIQEKDHNRVYMEQAGVVALVSALITNNTHEEDMINRVVVEEAINVLYLLKPSLETLKRASEDQNGLLIESLSLSIQHGSYQARIQSALLLKSIFEVVDESHKSVLRCELFEGITEILKDQNSVKLASAVLSILLEVMPFGKNKVKSVEAGVVSVLVELLAESNNKRSCEVMLEALEQICGRAEGRAAFLDHPASVAVVASKILTVSQMANERAVRVLLMVCRFCKCGTGGVARELVEVGGAAKLFMVVQVVGCDVKTKEKAKEILRSHLKPWMKSSSCNFSPCFNIA